MNKPTVEELKSGGRIITWKDLKAGEEVEWIEAIGNKRSAVAFGDFGPIGNCLIEGSNDKQNAGNLHCGFGGVRANLNKIGEFLELNELSRFIRPNVTGNEKTNLTVSIMVTL